MPVLIKTDQPEGNAYGIMGIVSKLLKEIHGHEKGGKLVEEYMEEVKSGDYENLKNVSLKYVNGFNVPPILMFVDSSEVKEKINIDVSDEVRERNLWWNNDTESTMTSIGQSPDETYDEIDDLLSDIE